MTVSSFATRAEADARAEFYRSMGYRVEVVAAPCTTITGPFWLRCEYVGG